MKIPSQDVPQADNLEDVVQVVNAVYNGSKTYQDIASSIGKVERQGRYYRRAAEILGFIKTPHTNKSSLTKLGLKFLQSGSREQNEILTRSVLGCRMIQRLLPFLEKPNEKGVNREELEKFISEVTEPVGPSMIPRRIATILNWLKAVQIIREKGNKISLNPLPEYVGVVDYLDDDEPLLPRHHHLSEYKEVERRVKNSIGNLTVLVNQIERERANKSHEKLTNLVARKIRGAGAIPKRNKLIDLATRYQGHDYIFEMKSTKDENIHHQVRKAVSQLYEYRYLQKAPEAELVLVIETELPHKYQWLTDYLVKDRKISLLWDGRDNDLFCPLDISSKFSFLNPFPV